MTSTLTGLASMFSQALKLHSTFPALCWLILNQLVFIPYLETRGWAGWWTGLEPASKAGIIILLALFIGYVLDSLNFIALGWFESNEIRSTWWGQAMTAWQRRRARREGNEGGEEYTALGSKLRGGKKRISNRYGIDATHIWPHLTAVLRENNYMEQVEREKSRFDFVFNLFLGLWISETSRS